jgi:hypothetical protein
MPSISVQVDTGTSAQQVKDLAAALEQLKRAAAGAGAAAKAAGGARKAQETSKQTASVNDRITASVKKVNQALSENQRLVDASNRVWTSLKASVKAGSV